MKKSYLLALIALTFVSAPARADTISIRADIWCPYNCDPKGDKPGYAIEIAKEIFGKAGHQIDYQQLNWARALEQVRTGAFTAAVGAAKTDAPDFVFPAAEVGMSSNVFAIRKGESFDYKDLSSLDGKVMAVVNDYTYADEVNDYITKNIKDPKKIQAASGDSALVTNLNKLVAKRVDLVLEDQNVLQNTINEQKMEDKASVVVGTLPVTQVYLAFSPANPKSKEYAELFDKGLAEMRSNGKLAAILAKYNLKDWH